MARSRTEALLMLNALSLAAALVVAALAPAVAQDGGTAAPAAAVPPSPAPASRPACPGNPDALGTARVLSIDPATLPPIGLKTYPQTLALADHEVVLTFDDGPAPRTTPRVLDALEHDCVRATFFLIGRNAASAPALVRREVADGDLVGHHSWSHPAVTERGLSDAAAREDVTRGFQADDRAAYGTIAGAPRVPVFRFPGFGDTPALLAWLKGLHVAVFGADLWASDWVRQTPAAEEALLMGRLGKAGRGIVLLHDIKEQTAAMLPAFLADLKAGGYQIVALRIGPAVEPQTRSAPAGWSSETERTLAALRPGHAPGAVRTSPARPVTPGPDDAVLPEPQ